MHELTTNLPKILIYKESAIIIIGFQMLCLMISHKTVWWRSGSLSDPIAMDPIRHCCSTVPDNESGSWGTATWDHTLGPVMLWLHCFIFRLESVGFLKLRLTGRKVRVVFLCSSICKGHTSLSQLESLLFLVRDCEPSCYGLALKNNTIKTVADLKRDDFLITPCV